MTTLKGGQCSHDGSHQTPFLAQAPPAGRPLLDPCRPSSFDMVSPQHAHTHTHIIAQHTCKGHRPCRHHHARDATAKTEARQDKGTGRAREEKGFARGKRGNAAWQKGRGGDEEGGGSMCHGLGQDGGMMNLTKASNVLCALLVLHDVGVGWGCHFHEATKNTLANG